jgi:hypothetical protein
MKPVLIFFVTAPAWKIFLLFVLPVILLFIGPMASIPFYIFLPIVIIGIWTDLLWIYSIGVLLHEKYSSYLNVPLFRFKICLIYNFLYSIFFVTNIIPLDYLGPFHLISFVCNMYALYFMSKLIVLIERKKEVKFQDYISTFIFAWLYFVGVWQIQPRVNKLFLSNDV